MEIKRITTENAAIYGEIMGPDLAENIGRTYYRGLAVHRDGRQEPAGGLLWEYRHMEGGGEREAMIVWFFAEDGDVAALLFDAYGEEVSSAGIARTRFALPVRRDGTRELLREMGFSVRLSEGDDIHVTIAELDAMPFLSSRRVPPEVTALRELSDRAFRQEIERCVSLGKRGVCEDLAYLPRSYFEPDVSSCYVREGAVEGLLLFHRLRSGRLEISLLFAEGGDYRRILPLIIRRSCVAAWEKYPPETEVVLRRHTEASLLLTEKLFPRGFGSPVYTGSREEATDPFLREMEGIA